jgi:hypothetical protein
MAKIGSYEGRLVDAVIQIGGVMFSEITVKEVILGESLTTPGLQTAVTLQSFIYSKVSKNLDQYKDQPITINMQTKDGRNTMFVNQQVYRIDNRHFDPINIGQTEEFTVHACDQSLLNDAQSLVSKSWKCTTPDQIVNYVLSSCAGVRNPVIDKASPARDYMADNVHPFQVVAQQCNVALDGQDPSFLHYMTYENGGTHYFRSLKYLKNQGPVKTFYHSEGNADLADPSRAIMFSFPCDFDYLSDLLNGVDKNGNPINTVTAWNPVSFNVNLHGGSVGGCGIGSGNHKTAITNKGTAQQQDGCEINVEEWLLLRQARMGLLEKDKTALRITVPWNPDLHVGNVIGLSWTNKYNNQPVYGAGNYVVASLTHNIQLGGFATTTMDCIKRVY